MQPLSVGNESAVLFSQAILCLRLLVDLMGHLATKPCRTMFASKLRSCRSSKKRNLSSQQHFFWQRGILAACLWGMTRTCNSRDSFHSLGFCVTSDVPWYFSSLIVLTNELIHAFFLIHFWCSQLLPSLTTDPFSCVQWLPSVVIAVDPMPA